MPTGESNMLRLIMLLAGVLATTSGCALLNSIHREFDLNDHKSQLIDVKQRSIIVSKDGERVCAEPSPDALSAYALAAQAAGNGGAQGAFAASETAASIGIRTAGIQLLRDAEYRLCEAFVSRGIDDEGYDIMMRRAQNNLIAFLAIEQLTGPVRPPSVVLTATANAQLGDMIESMQAKRAQAKDQLAAEKGRHDALIKEDEHRRSKKCNCRQRARSKGLESEHL